MTVPDLPAAAEALRSMAFALGVAELERGYADVRAGYRETVFDNVLRYLVQDGARATSFKAAVGQALIESFAEAFYVAYAESSGGAQVDPADDGRLTALINAEIGHVAQLFESLRVIKGKELPPGELVAEAEQRADGYARTLDYVASEGKLLGNKNKMLTFKGQRGAQDPCKDCAKWNGKRHSVKYWMKRGLIGRNGNPNFACGRWAGCQHGYYDDNDVLYAE